MLYSALVISVISYLNKFVRDLHESKSIEKNVTEKGYSWPSNMRNMIGLETAWI